MKIPFYSGRNMIRTVLSISTCLVSAAIALNPQAVLAQAPGCPTDMALDGVYISFEDRVVRYERMSNGMTAERENYFDGSNIIEYRSHPVGLVANSWEAATGRIVTGSLETVTFEQPAGPIPAPGPGVTWSATEISRFADGSGGTYALSLVVGNQDSLDIGGCTYTGFPITITRTDLSDGYVSEDAFGYINELGVVIYLGFGEGEGNVTFDFPTAISLLPPNEDGSPNRVDTK